MNSPASGLGASRLTNLKVERSGVDVPKVPLVLGAAALLLTIVGWVLMITKGFVPGLVTPRKRLRLHPAAHDHQ